MYKFFIFNTFYALKIKVRVRFRIIIIGKSEKKIRKTLNEKKGLNVFKKWIKCSFSVL